MKNSLLKGYSMHCCDTFEAAQKSGTDSEGHAQLIAYKIDVYEIGTGLPFLKFCPWCGDRVSKNHPIEAAAREVVDSMFGSNHVSWGDVKEAVGNLGAVLDKNAK